MHNAITDVPGIKVGQAQDDEALTGCTVIMCEKGAVAGVDQRGGGPGSREIALLNPVNHIEKIYAVMLSGGSAFGLDAASGVVQYLDEKGIGYDIRVTKIPIVPSVILNDLFIGNPKIRPDAEMGYQACLKASVKPPAEGNFGAGTGATVGKILGPTQAMKAGIGTASMEIGAGVIVGAIVAVNAIGDVIDPENGQIVAGARSVKKGPLKVGEGMFADALKVMRGLVGRTLLSLASRQNTVIGVVATNAKFDKPQATKMAQMAQNGVVRAIRPANTLHDGDTMFSMATGKKKADVNIVGAFAAQVVSQAILRSVHAAIGAGGYPAISDLK
ncbi:MAG: P1 family peptidase [Chloroflexi bacterium]|nr:P1 family peptidase [Chloroflexota bacterium]